MRVRKRPVEVEAVQWDGSETSYQKIEALSEGGRDIHLTPLGILWIDTLEGAMVADITDWIIRGINGEVYPCKDDIFQKTYEILSEPGSNL